MAETKKKPGRKPKIEEPVVEKNDEVESLKQLVKQHLKPLVV